MKSVICQLVEKLGTTTCFVFSPYHKDNDSNPFLNLIFFYQIQILNKRMSLLETLFPIRNGTLALQIQIPVHVHRGRPLQETLREGYYKKIKGSAI